MSVEQIGQGKRIRTSRTHSNSGMRLELIDHRDRDEINRVCEFRTAVYSDPDVGIYPQGMTTDVSPNIDYSKYMHHLAVKVGEEILSSIWVMGKRPEKPVLPVLGYKFSFEKGGEKVPITELLEETDIDRLLDEHICQIGGLTLRKDLRRSGSMIEATGKILGGMADIIEYCGYKEAVICSRPEQTPLYGGLGTRLMIPGVLYFDMIENGVVLAKDLPVNLMLGNEYRFLQSLERFYRPN